MKTVKDISKEKLSLQEFLTYLFLFEQCRADRHAHALQFQGSDISHLTAQLMR